MSASARWGWSVVAVCGLCAAPGLASNQSVPAADAATTMIRAASAGGYPSTHVVGTPRLLGGGVAWVGETSSGRAFVFRSDGGPTAGLLALDPLPAALQPARTDEDLVLAVSDQLVAVTRQVHTCLGDCKDQAPDLSESDITLSGPGGPRHVAGCGPNRGETACGSSGSCDSGQAAALAVNGDTTAYVDPCAGERRGVQITGPNPLRSVPGRAPIALAGPYLAVTQSTNTLSGAQLPTVVVFDLVSGQQVARVGAPALGALVMQPDGTFAVLYASQYAPRLAWASVSDPRLHDLGTSPPMLIALNQDRILLAVAESRATQITTIGLDGAIQAQGQLPIPAYASGVSNPVAPVAFDGRRVAFAVRPCQSDAIVVTDELSTGASTGGPNSCPLPRTGPTVLLTRMTARVSLVCPAAFEEGCLGTIGLAALARRATPHASAQLGQAVYEAAAGASTDVTIALGRQARRFLAVHRVPSVRATLTAPAPTTGGRPSVVHAVLRAIAPGVR